MVDEFLENEYIPEKILAERIVDGKNELLVKWEGYDDPEDNTWEPKENLEYLPFYRIWKNSQEKKNKKEDKVRSSYIY